MAEESQRDSDLTASGNAQPTSAQPRKPSKWRKAAAVALGVVGVAAWGALSVLTLGLCNVGFAVAALAYVGVSTVTPIVMGATAAAAAAITAVDVVANNGKDGAPRGLFRSCWGGLKSLFTKKPEAAVQQNAATMQNNSQSQQYVFHNAPGGSIVFTPGPAHAPHLSTTATNSDTGFSPQAVQTLQTPANSSQAGIYAGTGERSRMRPAMRHVGTPHPDISRHAGAKKRVRIRGLYDSPSAYGGLYAERQIHEEPLSPISPVVRSVKEEQGLDVSYVLKSYYDAAMQNCITSIQRLCMLVGFNLQNQVTVRQGKAARDFARNYLAQPQQINKVFPAVIDDSQASCLLHPDNKFLRVLRYYFKHNCLEPMPDHWQRQDIHNRIQLAKQLKHDLDAMSRTILQSNKKNLRMVVRQRLLFAAHDCCSQVKESYAQFSQHPQNVLLNGKDLASPLTSLSPSSRLFAKENQQPQGSGAKVIAPPQHGERRVLAEQQGAVAYGHQQVAGIYTQDFQPTRLQF